MGEALGWHVNPELMNESSKCHLIWNNQLSRTGLGLGFISTNWTGGIGSTTTKVFKGTCGISILQIFCDMNFSIVAEKTIITQNQTCCHIFSIIT